MASGVAIPGGVLPVNFSLVPVPAGRLAVALCPGQVACSVSHVCSIVPLISRVVAISRRPVPFDAAGCTGSGGLVERRLTRHV